MRKAQPPPPPVEESSSSDEELDEEEGACCSDAECDGCSGGSGGDELVTLPPAESAQLRALVVFEKTHLMPLVYATQATKEKGAPLDDLKEYRRLLLEREALYALHIAGKRDELVRQSLKRQRSSSTSAPPSEAFYTFLAKKTFRRVQKGFLIPLVEEMTSAWSECSSLAKLLGQFPLFGISVEDEKLLAAVTNVTRRFLCLDNANSQQAVDGIEYTLYFGRQEFHTSASARLQFFFAGSSFHRLGQVRFGRIIDVRASQMAWLPKGAKISEDSFFGLFFGSSGHRQLEEALEGNDSAATTVAAVAQHNGIRQMLQASMYEPLVVSDDVHVPRYDLLWWAGECHSKDGASTAAATSPVSFLSNANDTSPPQIKTLLQGIYGQKAVSSQAIISYVILLNASMQGVCTHFLYPLSGVDGIDLDEAEDGEDVEGDVEEFDDDEEEDEESEEDEAPPPVQKRTQPKPSTKPTGAPKDSPQAPSANPPMKKPECKQQ